MKRKFAASLGLCLGLLVPTLAHDLFLKPGTFFAKVNEKNSISLLNGTFILSEGVVSFSRLTDVSVISPSDVRTNPKESDFAKNETTAFLNLVPKETGNYVVGLSTAWRENQLKAKEFNEYLVAEGIPNILEDRKRDGELEIDGRYRYSKYVKTIFHVGGKQTDSYKAVLGYDVELVPRQNPYKLKVGDEIEILCLKDGKPLANQVVLTGSESGGKVTERESLTSDANGVIRIKLAARGKWYAKFINMTKIDYPKLNYESKWATLTFAIK